MREPQSDQEWLEYEEARECARTQVDGFEIYEYARRQQSLLEYAFGSEEPEIVVERKPPAREEYWDFHDEELNEEKGY